jgi:hypothetical protein
MQIDAEVGASVPFDGPPWAAADIEICIINGCFAL